MNKSIKFLIWGFILYMTLGFRIFSGKWDISKTDPTIWIKVCENTYTVDENDFEEGDPLAGVTGLTFSQVLQSVIDDYNNIPTSYLRLALYPDDPNNPGTPLAGDSAFTIEKGETRTIEICFGDTDPRAGVSGGYAMPKTEGKKLIGCEIKAKEEYLEKSLFLTHLLTHEIGHCFALMHAQEGTKSVMSYFGEKKARLQNDDYAGITYNYPDDEDYAKEINTYGLTSCSPK